MALKPHVIKVRFSVKPTVTQQQAGELWALGNEFSRVGAGLFQWTAECNAHTPRHAIDWAEDRLRAVLGDAALIEWLGVTVDRLAT